MRRLIVLAAAVGCAQTGAPPGGPPDAAPPRLLRTIPDTNAVNARRRSVEFRYDEVVSERPSGAPELAQLFLVSPRDGRIDVRWRRSRIEIRPRRGWRANTTYTVTQLPGLADLRGNADTTSHTLVFSTGPSRAQTVMRGQVFDWVAGRPAARALVEAVQLPDSLTYQEYADSLGRFEIRHAAPGQYLLRAVIDADRDRTLDPRESFDSATVTLGDSITREMLAFIHDSIGPGIAEVVRRDSTMLRVSFDRPLRPGVEVTLDQFTLKAADSSLVPLQSLALGRAFEQAEVDSARARAARDSVRRAEVADSIRRAGGQPAAPPAPPAAAPQAQRPAPADTTPEPPRPSRPPPETYAVLRLQTPLAPASSYRLRADSLESLTGVVRSSERVFTTPRPTARDSAAVRPDSAPPAAPRRPPDR